MQAKMECQNVPEEDPQGMQEVREYMLRGRLLSHRGVASYAAAQRCPITAVVRAKAATRVEMEK